MIRETKFYCEHNQVQPHSFLAMVESNMLVLYNSLVNALKQKSKHYFPSFSLSEHFTIILSLELDFQALFLFT